MDKNFYKKIGFASIAILLVLSLLGNPAIIFAEEQEDVTVESVYISVRPEYDFPPDWVDQDIPAVLVIHIADLVNNTDEPITSFSYPAPIDEPNFQTYAIGKLQSQGQYWPSPHVLSEGQILIDLREYPILPDEDYQLTVQYYYHPFTIEEQRKAFSFEFAPEFTVEKVTTSLQLPPAGRNARVEPATFALQDVVETNVNIDNPITIDIAYDKADNRPTVTGQNQSGQGTEGNNMLIGFAALLIIIGFVFFLVLSGKSSGDEGRKPKKSAKQQKTVETKISKAIETKQPKQPNQSKAENSTKGSSRPKPSVAASDEQKLLRKKLLAGDIDEKTYREEMKKFT